jgi:hypothetical protein
LKHGEDIMQNGEQTDTRAMTRRKFLAALAMGGMAVMASLTGADTAEAGGKKPRRPVKRRRVNTQNATQPQPAQPKRTADLERGTFVGWGGCNGCGQ